MKKFAAVIAALLVITAAGCNNTEQNTSADANTANTTAAESSGSKVTMVAFERDANTEDALKFLEQKVPLYMNYMKIRRNVPLTFKTTVTNESGTWQTGICIKDSEHFLNYSINPDGNETRAVYLKDTAYQIDTEKKIAYKYECGEGEIGQMFSSLTLNEIYLDEVEGSFYSSGAEEYNGTEYDFVSISSGTDTTKHYFDKTTGELAYSISGNNVTKVNELSNTFTDDALLEIPSDYEIKSYEDYINDYINSLAEQQAAQSEEE